MQSAGKLLPPQIHEVVLEGELEPKGRIIIIGDVHGCIKEMKELLVEAEYVHGVDTVILVGDLGDKGPYPLEVRSSHTMLTGITCMAPDAKNAAGKIVGMRCRASAFGLIVVVCVTLAGQRRQQTFKPC